MLQIAHASGSEQTRLMMIGRTMCQVQTLTATLATCNCYIGNMWWLNDASGNGDTAPAMLPC
jgi:hypothetical protein